MSGSSWSPAAGSSLIFALLAAAAVSLGCSSSSSPPPTSSSDGAVSGAVPGDTDMHCSNVTTVVVNPASCSPPADAATAPPVDAGSPYGPTMYNAEGDDDDCKYHVNFDVTPDVSLNGKLTFKLTVKKKADLSPATGAIDSNGDGVALEAFLDSNNNHVAPNTTPPTRATETPAGSGIYTITPVEFDMSGRWVVRFHLFELCSDDLDDSPHGHAAFFYDVP
jgi:hypothetical protein